MIEETNLDICGCKNDSLDLKNIDRKLRLNARNQVQHSQKATAKIRGKNYSCVMLANKQLQRMPKLLCGKFRFKDMWPCSCVLNGLNRLLRPDVLYGQSLPSTSSQLTEAEKFLADLLNCRYVFSTLVQSNRVLFREKRPHRCSAGLTIVAIATGSALLGSPRSSVISLIYLLLHYIRGFLKVF